MTLTHKPMSYCPLRQIYKFALEFISVFSRKITLYFYGTHFPYSYGPYR